ncbi:hypothetical protein EYF80_019969 [Liparis tanakae]|uniref:Uncharacterized protein n=1 Tax=Liparis tanakae TaxID=230148 RepID=A0A4Z2HWE0_9TELE|nr:hypothetical protein EYF80_019969 [Liparis tanakae]
MSDVTDFTLELARPSLPLQLSSCETRDMTTHSFFKRTFSYAHNGKTFVNMIQKLTSSFSPLQLFSCSFKFCRSFIACRLAMELPLCDGAVPLLDVLFGLGMELNLVNELLLLQVGLLQILCSFIQSNLFGKQNKRVFSKTS